MPVYIFKNKDELIWIAIIAAVALVLQSLEGGAIPTDWTKWAIAIAVGVLRAVLGKMVEVTTPTTKGAYDG